jgi:hypothetical protein
MQQGGLQKLKQHQRLLGGEAEEVLGRLRGWLVGRLVR